MNEGDEGDELTFRFIEIGESSEIFLANENLRIPQRWKIAICFDRDHFLDSRSLSLWTAEICFRLTLPFSFEVTSNCPFPS